MTAAEFTPLTSMSGYWGVVLNITVSASIASAAKNSQISSLPLIVTVTLMVDSPFKMPSGTKNTVRS